MAQVSQVDVDVPAVADEPESRPGGLPLYVWVVLAAALAVPFGLFVPRQVAGVAVAPILDAFPTVIIRALTALATPLVVMAILNALITNDIRGRQGFLMMVYYGINTLVAIVIGLALANLIRPGVGVNLGQIQNNVAAPAVRRVEEKTSFMAMHKARRL